MFVKIITLFALVAVAFAAPKPEPSPQVLAYASTLDYVNPYAAAYPSVYSPYAAPLTYSAYSAYPAGAYYVR